MKTTIDIPEEMLRETMRITGAKTKRDAVLKALENFNRKKLVEELVASFGTWDIASNEEIEAGDMKAIEEIETSAKRKTPRFVAPRK